MKVNESSLNQAAASHLGKARQTEAVTPGGPKKDGEAAAPLGSDRVQLSDLSGRLLKLLNTESPERAARFERLAAEVRSGRYEVDALAVSRRIIDDALTNEP